MSLDRTINKMDDPPKPIQPLPHQQGHGALITTLDSSLGQYAYFSPLETRARHLSERGQTYFHVLAFLMSFMK